MDGIVTEKYYLKQWFIMIDIDYINMTKTKRQKELLHILDAICNYYLYEDYKELKKEIEQYAVEHNCNVTDITYGKYPDHIEW